MKKQIAQGTMYGGAFVALASVLSEFQQAKTFADLLTPQHVFGALGAVLVAVGAFFHPAPER